MSSNIETTIIYFIRELLDHRIISVLLIGLLILITEKYKVGITSLIFGKNNKKVNYSGLFKNNLMFITVFVFIVLILVAVYLFINSSLSSMAVLIMVICVLVIFLAWVGKIINQEKKNGLGS
jgi:cobalamin synthase